MAVESWAATAAETEVIAADRYRGEIEIQHTAGDAVFLGIGEAAVDAKGICIKSGAPYYRLTGVIATQAIRMICTSGESASGGYATR